MVAARATPGRVCGRPGADPGADGDECGGGEVHHPGRDLEPVAIDLSEVGADRQRAQPCDQHEWPVEGGAPSEPDHDSGRGDDQHEHADRGVLAEAELLAEDRRVLAHPVVEELSTVAVVRQQRGRKEQLGECRSDGEGHERGDDRPPTFTDGSHDPVDTWLVRRPIVEHVVQRHRGNHAEEHDRLAAHVECQCDERSQARPVVVSTR